MSEPESAINHSCLYRGSIRHRRFTPVLHAFRYSMFMWYLDLDELDALAQKSWFFSFKRFAPVRFKREDFFGDPNKDLKESVVEQVQTFFDANDIVCAPIKSVRVLTHLRYFNVIFNPVSFYYCFDEQENLLAILAQITNTPWEERHHYILPCYEAPHVTSPNAQQGVLRASKPREDTQRFEFAKKFHVSPFNPMNMDYNWVFTTPSQRLAVHMDNTVAADNGVTEKHFDATLGLKRVPLSDAAPVVLKQPFMTLKVVAGIYWEALRLWLKGSPFYDHPDTSTVNGNAENNVRNTVTKEIV